MAKTPISGATPYCTVDQFLVGFDVRTAGDYLGDAGVRLTSAEVATSTVLNALLMRASGMFEAAMLRGNKYTPADLAALAAANSGDGCNASEYVAMIVGGLAGYLLFLRRPARFSQDQAPGSAQLALDAIDFLNQGGLILGFQETADAGQVQHHVETARDVEHRNGATYQAGRYFGRRSNRSGD